MQVQENLRAEITIQNVICTADLKQKVDIASFNNYKFLNSNLTLYCCGYIKDNKMIGKVTVFGNGKLISAGTKTPEMACGELVRASQILKNYNLIDNFKIIPQIRNIVGRFDIGKKIHLEQMVRIMPKTMYEPEQFPGIIFRIHKSLVALIFASGKGVLVGGKSINEMNQGLFEIEHWINKT